MVVVVMSENVFRTFPEELKSYDAMPFLKYYYLLVLELRLTKQL